MSRPIAIVFGATGGIGSATVASFVRRSCDVYAVDNAPEDRLSGVTYIDARPVSSEHEVFDQLARACADRPAHVAIATAGAMMQEIALDESVLFVESEWLLSETVKVNLIETISIVTAMTRILSPGSSMTLSSSVNASGDFGYPYYSASKAAIEGFVRSSARPLGRRGIRINAISFGTVRTARSEELHASNEEHFERLRRLAATNRLTTSDEAGIAMTSLALDLTNVVGVVLSCDGGQGIPGNHTKI